MVCLLQKSSGHLNYAYRKLKNKRLGDQSSSAPRSPKPFVAIAAPKKTSSNSSTFVHEATYGSVSRATTAYATSPLVPYQ